MQFSLNNEKCKASNYECTLSSHQTKTVLFDIKLQIFCETISSYSSVSPLKHTKLLFFPTEFGT
jgi:hypothetical protein